MPGPDHVSFSVTEGPADQFGTRAVSEFMSFISDLFLIMLRSIGRPRDVLYPAQAEPSCCGLDSQSGSRVSRSVIGGGPEGFGLRDFELGAVCWRLWVS